MRRRSVLAGATAFVGLLAGCGGDSGEPTESPTESPTATETVTATPTATASPTPSPTPTATPTPEPVAHELDERFVVDEGGQPFAYTVHEARRTDRIVTTSADEGHTFVVVTCTVENLQDEEVTLPNEDIWLRATGVRKSASIPLTDSAASDPRVAERSLTGSALFADKPTRGVVAFGNVPLAPTDYRLLFTPPGTTGPISSDPTRTHQVPIGALNRVAAIE